MSITPILTAIRTAHSPAELRTITENALDVYSFDEPAAAEIRRASVEAAFLLARQDSESATLECPIIPAADDDLITDLEAECIAEPHGEFGLYGYQRGDSYRAQFVCPADGRPPYYRLYPSTSSPGHFECAIPRVAARFFRISEIA